MNRLITLGCSHTECTQGVDSSKKSWPYILSLKLNRKLINLGKPAGSNRTIQHKVYNFNFNKKDTVIILWTYPDRYHFFKDKNNSTGLINSWGIGRSETWFKEFHTSYNEKFDNRTIVNQVNLFLKNQKIKVYNLVVSLEFDYFFNFPMKIDYIDIDFTKNFLKKYRRGIDGWHMGEKANYNYATAVYNKISGSKDKFWVEELI